MVNIISSFGFLLNLRTQTNLKFNLNSLTNFLTLVILLRYFLNQKVYDITLVSLVHITHH